MKIYINAAKSIGATPVIISPVTRRYLGSDGKIDTTWTGYLGAYAVGAQAIATAENIPFIDLFDLSVSHHNEIGETASMLYNGPTNTKDITHFNIIGAEAITNLIVEEMEVVLPNLATHLLINSYNDICSPVGWATHNGSVTGGKGGDTISVSTFADLKSHAESEAAKVIILTGSVGTGGGANSRIYIKSNKTILGDKGAELHGYFIINKMSNIIIRNLKVRGDGARDNGNDDGISVITSSRLWFDHLDISDGEDGNLDIKRESNYITISWCKFSYTSASTAHEFSNLIGHSDDHLADRGHSKVTLHHNYWAAGVRQRMPSVRFGQVHIVNNYYRSDSDGNDYCIAAGKEANLLIENNVFENIQQPLRYIGEAATAVELNNNLFINAPGDKVETGTAFSPPYPYIMTAPEDVETLVKNNPGPTDLNDLLCSGHLSVDCNGIPNGGAFEDKCGICVAGNTGLTACTEIIEAETACSVDGVKNESTNSGFSGNGYVNPTNANGAFVTYMITSEKDQQVELGYRFANGGTAARPGIIYVNGQVGNKIPLPTALSWINWEIARTNVNLVKGVNKIEIRATSVEGLANLDYITIHNNSISSASCNVCNGTLLGTAAIDDCGFCSGGLTKKEPSSPIFWYADIDNDNLGDPANSVEDCEQPNGYVDNSNDQCPNNQTNICLVTSLKSHSNNKISLFPNPANESINISENSNWKLVDIYGNILSKGEENKIDLANISSGVYVIITGTQSHKIIKQ